MFVPEDYQATEEQTRGWLARPGLAEVVTRGSRFLSSAIPLVHQPDQTRWGRFLGHLDRRNPQWRDHDGTALVVLRGPEGYVSPAWRPARGEKALPTWDFERVEITGRYVVHDDPAWVEAQLRALIALYEPTDWRFDDADEAHVRALLPLIVGFEVLIEDVVAEAKLGQDRDASDQARIADELTRAGCPHLAREIARQAGPGQVV